MANATPQPDPEVATRKEQYELLIDLLKSQYRGLISFEISQFTFLVLVIGWIITSGLARDFFEKHTNVAYIICVFLLMWTSSHVMWVHTWYRRSRAAFGHLVEMQYMCSKYFESELIPRRTILSLWITHSVLTIIICITIIVFTQTDVNPEQP